MAEFMTGLKRTGYVHTLTKEMVGKQVTITGWAQKARNLGSLIFIDLRDRTGIAQLVFDADTDPALFEKAATVRAEFVLAATGIVRERAPEAVNPRLVTGEIEVAVTDLRILNDSQTPPFHIDDKVNVSDAVRLKHRYLDLRRPCMRDMLLMRHRIAKIARDYFDRNDFIEIETPILTKSTPEGARDYLVPSRVHPGKFYALPQSPQIFKQLLMVSGFDRYIQICKCFRDEDLRADRQPEFTQIDIEMSFVDEDDVMTMNEGFLKEVFKEVLDIDVPTPFTRMPYAEAMARYGSDKPDVRFGLELCDISDFAKDCSFGVFANSVKDGGAVRLICAPAGHFTRKEIDGLTEFIKMHGGSGMAWIAPGDDAHRSSLGKVLTPDELQQIIDLAGAKTGDLICIVCGKSNTVYTALGALRCHIADKLNLIPKDQFAFLWITDFPQFEYSEEEDRYVAVHHPFTMPKEEDIDKLMAKINEHNLNPETFNWYLDLRKYGSVPHAGFGLGIERTVAWICGLHHVRETIPFARLMDRLRP